MCGMATGTSTSEQRVMLGSCWFICSRIETMGMGTGEEGVAGDGGSAGVVDVLLVAVVAVAVVAGAALAAIMGRSSAVR